MRGKIDSQEEYASLRIKEIMDERGLSLSELTSRAKINHATASKYYHNNAMMFDRIILSRIARVLELNVADLFSNK